MNTHASTSEVFPQIGAEGSDDRPVGDGFDAAPFAQGVASGLCL